MEFNFTVNGDRLRMSGKSEGVSGNSNTYECNFTFSDEYNSLTSFAVFVAGEESFTVEIRNNKCIVPYEVLEQTNILQIGVFATNTDDEDFKRFSTNFVGININTGAYSILSIPGTPDLWERYLSDVKKEREAAQKAKEDAIAAAEEAAKKASEIAAKEAADKVTENIDENIRQEVLSQRDDIVADVLSALPDGDEVSY